MFDVFVQLVIAAIMMVPPERFSVVLAITLADFGTSNIVKGLLIDEYISRCH